MERLKTLTTLTWMLGAIIFFELAFLAYLAKPQTAIPWITIVVIAVSCLYLVRMCLGLLRELKNKHKE